MTRSTNSNENSEKSQKQDDLTDAARPSGLRPLDYVLLSVAATQSTLRVLAANHWQIVHLGRALMVAFGLALLACGVAHMAIRLGARRHVAVFTTLVAVLLATSGGAVLWAFDPALGWALLAGIVIATGLLSRRFDEHMLTIVGVCVVVMLASGALIDLYNGITAMGEDQAVISTPATVELTETPDIYLIVVDAYLGRQALLNEFGDDKADLVSSLESEGFQVPVSAWSAFQTTDLAVPAILDMSYPAEPEGLSDATKQTLHRVLAGDNATVAILNANGYETVKIESGWAGSYCGDAFDDCISSHWLDEIQANMAWNSVASRFVANTWGHAFTANALHNMEELRRLAKEPSETPRFVFGHIIAPHPPLLLDETCALDFSERGMETVGKGLTTDDDPRFLAQMACVDSFMNEFAGMVGDDDIVIFIGDHGVRRAYPDGSPERSTSEKLVESMNVFLATKLPAGCTLADPIITTDLMRNVISCLTDTQLVPVTQRMVPSNGPELSQAEIDELINAPFVAEAPSG